MKLFDAHCHIQFPVYDVDRDAVIARAHEVGVSMIVVGTHAASSAAAIALVEKYSHDVWATVGFHPNHASSDARADANWHHDKQEQREEVREIFDIEKLHILARHPKVVAIGECGIDYYRMRHDDRRTKDEQRRIFLAQAQLAQALGKPLMIHARASKGTDDAYEDVFSVSHSAALRSENPVLKILHFYAGSLAMTKKFVDDGYYFTFGGVTTFTREYDDVIRYIPMERIMPETDAPYVAPVPYRGQRNEPAYVREVVKRIAGIKGLSEEVVAQATTQNTLQVFNIKA